MAGPLGLQAAAATAQPFLAGAHLNGHLRAIEIHSLLGDVVGLLGLVAVVAALLYRLVAHGPWWPLVAAGVIFLAEAAQIGFGYSRSLGLHIPLGVFVVGSAIGLFIRFLRSTRPEGDDRATA